MKRLTKQLFFSTKTILLTSLLLLLSFNSCYSQTDSLKNEERKQIEDTISKFLLTTSPAVKITYAEEYSGYGTGSGFVTAKKGYKFLGVYVNISNPTKEPIDVNLKEALLLDTASKIKYDIHAVMGTGPFTIYKKAENTLKPGKDLNRKLVFLTPNDFNVPLLLYRYSLLAVTNIQK